MEDKMTASVVMSRDLYEKTKVKARQEHRDFTKLINYLLENYVKE